MAYLREDKRVLHNFCIYKINTSEELYVFNLNDTLLGYKRQWLANFESMSELILAKQVCDHKTIEHSTVVRPKKRRPDYL